MPSLLACLAAEEPEEDEEEEPAPAWDEEQEPVPEGQWDEQEEFYLEEDQAAAAEGEEEQWAQAQPQARPRAQAQAQARAAKAAQLVKMQVKVNGEQPRTFLAHIQQTTTPKQGGKPNRQTDRQPLPTKERVIFNGRNAIVYMYKRGTVRYVKSQGKFVRL